MFDGSHAAMPTRSRGHRPFTAFLLTLLLVAPRFVHSQAPTDSTAGTPPPDVAAAAAAQGTITATQADSLPDSDGGWPRLIPCPSGATMILYQPQLLSWKDQRQLVAMCAVSYT